MLVGAVACLVAWAVLVRSAISLGLEARAVSGPAAGRAWVPLVVASAGAVACLSVALLLGSALVRRLAQLPRRGVAGPSPLPPPSRPEGGAAAS